jgi:hypothetical protein
MTGIPCLVAIGIFLPYFYSSLNWVYSGWLLAVISCFRNTFNLELFPQKHILILRGSDPHVVKFS